MASELSEAVSYRAPTSEEEIVAEGSRTEGRRATRDKLKSGGRSVRTKIASAVWLVAVVCALFLAVGVRQRRNHRVRVPAQRAGAGAAGRTRSRR